MSDSFNNRPMIKYGKQSSKVDTGSMQLPGFNYPAFNAAKQNRDVKEAQRLISQYAASAGTSPAVISRMLGFGG